MTGMSAEVLRHIVGRSIASFSAASAQGAQVAAPSAHHGQPTPGDAFHFNGFAMASIVVIAVVTFVVVASVEYTVGNLMATMAMVESTSTTTIIESPPVYTDEPDAPLDKKTYSQETDIEIVTIKHKPITNSIKSTIMHLHRVGGFRARWRGLGQNMLYQFGLNFVSMLFARVLFSRSGPLLARALGLFCASLITIRLHMLSTHAMIAAPTSVPWYRRFVAHGRHLRVVMLPTFVYALARQAAVAAPFATWYFLGVFDIIEPSSSIRQARGAEHALVALRILAGPVALLAVVFFLSLPAYATLVRVEACLLPEQFGTIVPFDREGLVGDLDLTVRGAPRKLYASAWKSFSFCARIRVIKLYAKMVMFQVGFVMFNAILAMTIFYISGKDQIDALAAQVMA